MSIEDRDAHDKSESNKEGSDVVLPSWRAYFVNC